jgi:DNA-binding beta-propeller fold protein YncE
VKVSWTAGEVSALCPSGVPPAIDNVTPAANLVYIVSYKLTSETGFSTATSLPGATLLEVAGLSPKQAYEFKVQARDLADWVSDFRSLDGSITMPPAGRLYAANFLANAVSSIPDIGTVNGDRVGTQVFSANETGLSTPIGVAVNAGSVTLQDATSCAPSAAPCQAPSMLYVSNWAANSITAYENPETLGRYDKLSPDELQRINATPAWTITGLATGLAEPAALWVDREIVDNTTREILYVANMRGTSRTLFEEQPVGNILAFDVTRKDGNRTGAPQASNGNSPPFGKIKSPWFVTPMAFAVDKGHHRLYVANRDKVYSSRGVFDQAGTQILAFEIPPDAPDGPSGLYRLMNPLPGDPDPFRYTIQGFCTAQVSCSLLGPTGIALDEDNDRLYVANRGQNNLVVIENAHLAGGPHTTRVIEGPSAKLVIDHPTSSQYNASPNAVFFDPVTRRLFATTRNAQSVLIFDVSNTVMGATGATTIVEGPLDPQLTPIRVIRGSKTGLGQPTRQTDPFGTPQQSSGPFGITVVSDTSGTSTVSTAYVASFGLHAIPIFDVSPDQAKDALPPNTPPIRLLMDPMQGLTGAALDRVNDRLYVAVFHSNLILVYDKVYDKVSPLTGSHLLPDRIIGGPDTKLDHPVHLVFSPATADHTAALFVANQSGHSVLVFGGEPLPVLPGETALDVGDLNGNVAPSRVIGPLNGTDHPFALDNPAELAYPTGIALDEQSGVLYVSNRDAAALEDFAGRKILAFKDAFVVNGNVPPTWKIKGDAPPPPGYNPLVTDKTTLQRPAALYYDAKLDRLYVANRGRRTILVFGNIPDPDPNLGPYGMTETVLKSPPLIDYNVAPAWTITNAYLNEPTGFAGYAPNGSLSELYVADAAISGILVFRVDALDPDVRSPTLTPRLIWGTSLGLLQPFGLALDPEK